MAEGTLYLLEHLLKGEVIFIIPGSLFNLFFVEALNNGVHPPTDLSGLIDDGYPN